MGEEIYQDCESKPVREPELSREMRRLAETIERLRKNCEQLAGKLKPVMQDEHPMAEDCEKEQSCETLLGKEIRTRVADVQSINGLINSIIERVEL